MTGPACDLCGLGCGKHPLTQRAGDVERCFCCLGCQNVFLILAESGIVATGQDLRETELFKRSLALGLISRENAEVSRTAKPAGPRSPEACPRRKNYFCKSGGCGAPPAPG